MNWNDVRDFGATGDGKGDDTDAIQAALDAGGITLFPAGIYNTRRLTVPSGAVLRGVGGGSFDMPYLPDRQLSTLELVAETDADCMLYGAPESQGVLIEGLQLYGNRYYQTTRSCGIYLEQGAAPPPPPYTQEAGWTLRGVYAHNFKADGLYIGLNRRNNLIERCSFIENGQHGVNLWGSDSVLAYCDLGVNGAHGVNVGGTLTRIANCNIFGNTIGVNVLAWTFGVTVLGCGIDRNRQYGVRVETHATGVNLTGNVLGSNSQEADDGYAHVLICEAGSAAAVANAFVRQASGLANRASWAVELAAGAQATGVEHNTLAPDATHRGLTNALRHDGWEA